MVPVTSTSNWSKNKRGFVWEEQDCIAALEAVLEPIQPGWGTFFKAASEALGGLYWTITAELLLCNNEGCFVLCDHNSKSVIM
ncbi:hypothetical protein Tco_0258118 [Tanacetum coccineum]